MNLKDLWIGELLHIKGTKIVGTFEGLESEHIVLVKINHQIKKFVSDQLELVEDSHDSSPDISDIIVPEKTKSNFILNNTIDLHIEILNPSLINQSPERILAYQLKAVEEFITLHKNRKTDYVIIIHGKGEGFLRNQVHELAKLKFKARLIHLINNDGASEIWL